MKRFIKMILFCSTLGTLAISVSACGNKIATKQKNGYFVNSEFSTNGMKEIDGEDVKLDDKKVSVDPEMGMGLRFTDNVFNLIEKDKLIGYVIAPYMMGIGYYVDDSRVLDVMGIYRYEDGIDDMEETFNIWGGIYEDIKEIAKIDNNTYYVGSNREFDLNGLSDEQKADVELIKADIDKLINNVSVFPPASKEELYQNQKIEGVGVLKNFEAQTLSGETITQDIFSNYDITMINIWATWCSPCILELPEIAKLHKDLPEGANIISICTDALGNEDFVKDILEQSNADFTTIISSEQIERDFLPNITSIPYTIFVDSNGELVGDVQIGVPNSTSIKEEYKRMIDERLKIVRGGQQ